MAGRHAEDQQESTYRWIKRLGQHANILGSLVKGLEVLLDQARGRQVATTSLAAEIEAVLDLVKAAHNEMRTIHAHARRTNRRIIDRYENPRKNQGAERRADVKPALRDN